MPQSQQGEVDGTVKWFNPDKGYGFLVADGGGDEVFVHYSAILGEGWRTLRPGSRVHFALIVGPKGRTAASVQTVGPVPTTPLP